MKRSLLSLLFILLIFPLLQTCGSNDDEFPNDGDDLTRREGFVAVYEVNGNQITLIEEGDAAQGFYNATRQRELWTFITDLIPMSARTAIVEWELFADGDDDTAAFVAPLEDNDLTDWYMGHNMDIVWDFQGDFIEGETGYTTIHELAHVLTLETSQIDVNVNENGCDNFFPGEGCSRTESYINAFFQQFWTDIYAENRSFDENDFDAVDAFYAKYSDQFVTAYAATNPGEDIAESFSYFVMDEPANGSSIRDQKVRFWNDYPEMVALAQQIRANINFTYDLDAINTERAERFKQRGFTYHTH